MTDPLIPPTAEAAGMIAARLSARTHGLVNHGAEICEAFMPQSEVPVSCGRCGYLAEVHDIRDANRVIATLRAERDRLQRELAKYADPNLVWVERSELAEWQAAESTCEALRGQLAQLKAAIALPECTCGHTYDWHNADGCQFEGCHCGKWNEAAASRDARTPTGLEEGSATHCDGCGGEYRYDVSIPSTLWNRVIRVQGIPEFLCAACILREFAKAVEPFTANLFGDGLDGMMIHVEVCGKVPAAPVSPPEEAIQRLKERLERLVHLTCEKYQQLPKGTDFNPCQKCGGSRVHHDIKALLALHEASAASLARLEGEAAAAQHELIFYRDTTKAQRERAEQAEAALAHLQRAMAAQLTAKRDCSIHGEDQASASPTGREEER